MLSRPLRLKCALHNPISKVQIKSRIQSPPKSKQHNTAAAPSLMTEQNFRKIMGDRDLGMLKAALDQKGVLGQQEVAQNEPARRSPLTILGTPSNQKFETVANFSRMGSHLGIR
jgi:hypothetical protein